MIIIDQLLSRDSVANITQQLQQCPWSNGAETAMGMAADVKHNSQADAQHPAVQALANQLLSVLGNHPQFVSAALPQTIFPPCFNRFQQAETYGYHVDAAIMRLPNSPQVMRSDLSITVFLSEPESYQGGELHIATDYGLQKVKLPAGSACVYPSSSLHQVTPVTKGQRLAAIAWIQSMVPSRTVRDELYNLDQSIQALSGNDAVDREQLDRLHRVYHNLIREFAEV